MIYQQANLGGHKVSFMAPLRYSVFPWSKKQGELVWLKHPEKDSATEPPTARRWSKGKIEMTND